MRMLEMPLAQLEQNVQAEMDENPALEGEEPDFAGDRTEREADDSDGDDDFEAEEERKEREDELDSALDSLDRDDRMDSSNYERANNNDPDADQEELI